MCCSVDDDLKSTITKPEKIQMESVKTHSDKENNLLKDKISKLEKKNSILQKRILDMQKSSQSNG